MVFSDTPRMARWDAKVWRSPYLLPPHGTLDRSVIAALRGGKDVHEIKEWQAIMDHLRGLPSKGTGQLPVVPVDGRAAEVRAIPAA